MDLTDRIIAYCERKKIKQIDLIDIGCGSKGTINNVFRKKNEPSMKFIEAFLTHFKDINARQLLTGEEDLILEETGIHYGKCKECIEKEGVIKFLEKKCAEKDRLIEELQRGAGSQTDSKKEAS